jgi:hypothetical protein
MNGTRLGLIGLVSGALASAGCTDAPEPSGASSKSSIAAAVEADERPAPGEAAGSSDEAEDEAAEGAATSEEASGESSAATSEEAPGEPAAPDEAGQAPSDADREDGAERSEDGTPGAEETEDEARADAAGADDEAVGASIVSWEVPEVAAAGTTLELRWRVLSPSGLVVLDGLPAAWVKLGGPSGWVTWADFPTMGDLVEGDDREGVFAARMPIPAQAVNGNYTVFLGAAGNAGPSVEAPGVEFVITGGATDGTAPRIFDLDATLSSSGDATLTLRFRATDDTEVAWIVPWVIGPNGFLTRPDGQLWSPVTSATQETGSPQDGLWVWNAPIPDAAPGLYKLWFSVADSLGNRDQLFAESDGTPFAEFTIP